MKRASSVFLVVVVFSMFALLVVAAASNSRLLFAMAVVCLALLAYGTLDGAALRWPWALLGCLHAIAGRVAGRESSFKVTPKGRSGAAPLPTRVVCPYLLLALASATPALLGLNAGQAHGYYTLALINVGLYMTAAVAILALHIFEHPRQLRAGVIRRSVGKIAATAVSASIALSAVVAPGVLVAPETVSALQPKPFPLAASFTSSLVLGVTTDALAKNSTVPWGAGDLTAVNAFEQTAHAHAGVVGVQAGRIRAVDRSGAARGL